MLVNIFVLAIAVFGGGGGATTSSTARVLVGGTRLFEKNEELFRVDKAADAGEADVEPLRTRHAMLGDRPIVYYAYDHDSDSPWLNWRRPGCTWGKEKNSLSLEQLGLDEAAPATSRAASSSTSSALFNALERAGFDGKHMSDVFFSERALAPPRSRSGSWRTLNPSEAEVFVVPALLNLLAQSTSGWWPDLAPVCCDEICGEALAVKMDEALGESKWFRRRKGLDHLVVFSHWIEHEEMKTAFESTLVAKLPHLRKANVITFEGDLWWQGEPHQAHVVGTRKRIPDLYVPAVCSSPTISPPRRGGEIVGLLHDAAGFLQQRQIMPPLDLLEMLQQHEDGEGQHDRGTTSTSPVAEIHPRAGFFSMIGQVDHRPAYRFRRCVCEAITHIPDRHVRALSVCASTSNSSATVFPAKCRGDKDHWPSISNKAPEEVACTMQKSKRKYCDAVRKTRFTLYAAGDTPSSNRLADAIQYGSIPVFLQKNQTAVLPFQNRVPWQAFSVMAELEEAGGAGWSSGSSRSTARRTDSVLSSEGEGVCDRDQLAELFLRVARLDSEKMAREMAKYRRYLSWIDEDSLVFEMFLREIVVTAG